MTIAPARSILACVTLVALVPALVLAEELRPEDLTTIIERGSAEYAYSGDLEAISQMPKENAGAGELDHAEEVLGVILPAVTARRKLWSHAKKRSTFQRRRVRRSARPSWVRARPRRCAAIISMPYVVSRVSSRRSLS
jgi:hypothetical protein